MTAPRPYFVALTVTLQLEGSIQAFSPLDAERRARLLWRENNCEGFSVADYSVTLMHVEEEEDGGAR